jgi:hypothetical protein
LRHLAGVFAILVLLRGLAFGDGLAAEAHASAVVATSAIGECAPQARTDGTTPGRPDHADCSILCSLSCADRQSPPPAILAGRAPVAKSRALSGFAPIAEGGPVREHSAWTGSASPRGPPTLLPPIERSPRAA